MIRPWVQWYGSQIPQRLPKPEGPLYSYLLRAAWRYPEQPALYFYGRAFSYAELENLSYRFAHILAHHFGVQKGDRVALLLPNVPQFVFSLYGILRQGAVAVPLNPLFVERELEALIRQSGAEIVVVLDSLAERVARIREKAGIRHLILTRVHPYLPTLARFLAPAAALPPEILSEHTGAVRWLEDLMDETPDIPDGDPVSLEDPALLLSTGGTTGEPKGVMLTHRNLVANLQQCRLWFPKGREAGEVFLGVIPFFHAYGLTVCLNLAIAMASPLVLLPRFQPKDVCRAIERHGVTIFIGVDAMFHALCEFPEVGAYDLSSLRYGISGAGPLRKEVQDRFEALTGIRLVEGYGLTEASPVTHGNLLEGERRDGSIGIPIPETDARIVDPEDGRREVRVGEVGELVVRGPQVMQGYWNRPEETAQVLRNGWLFTGDLARMDRDGFFYIVERKKDMIKSGGENVYPREVEEVLSRHPAVAEVAVVGIPDSFKGEVVKAFVVLKDGTHTTAEELIRYCEGELAPFKVPTAVEFRESLPRTFLGKPLRRLLQGEKGKGGDRP